MTDTRPHVVILGGGFAGLYAARRLHKADVRITLIDRHNYHLFQPLLYQVATAALNPSDIAAPIRSILHRQKNVTVLLAEAKSIDPAAKKVLLTDGEISYDQLIVATGTTHSYFGRDDWMNLAPGLKSIDDALEMRRRVLYAFEAAERETDPSRQRAWLNFVIVGGGPTGSELAGALAEIATETLVRDFRHVDPKDARVILVEGAPRVLPTYVPPLSEKAKEQLKHIGVEVRTNARVTNIDAEGVNIGDERIPAKTVLWAAGVAASPLSRSLDAPLDRAGRVKVERDLTVPNHPDIYVVGDLASLEQDGKPVFGVAQAALQAGRHAAENILRSLAGQQRTPFHYNDKGSMATLGRRAAVADVRGLKLSGFLAWLMWGLIHVLFLIGFRNRVLVMIEWGWQYLTFGRGVRLITGEDDLRGRHPMIANGRVTTTVQSDALHATGAPVVKPAVDGSLQPPPQR